MARISHQTVLGAYDKIASQISNQSGDKRFSGADAKAAQEAAYKAGRQDEAQLIGSVFGELKAAEGMGGTVTSADVKAGREFLATMLDIADGAARKDGLNNGLSKAELALLGPIVDQLVQSAKMDKVLATPQPGRKSKDILFAGLNAAADVLKGAMGNGRLAPAEVASALQGADANVAFLARALYATAKGTEKAGGHIGGGDIDRAVAIHSANIRRRDSGAAGLDNAELNAMPPMYATAYHVGRMLSA
ncbi:MAG: hypothetical protein RMA76_17665 [Deltaproteobacteria bacterium]|jgi:hypothetical protein